MNELLLPGSIISSRTRVRLDGTSVTKIVVDKNDQHFLEERVNAIKAAYKKIASRDIEIEFQKEATYYVLKKGERRWSVISQIVLYLFNLNHLLPILRINFLLLNSIYWETSLPSFCCWFFKQNDWLVDFPWVVVVVVLKISL